MARKKKEIVDTSITEIVVEENPTPIVETIEVKPTEVEKLEALKQKLLVSLDSAEFALPFFSKVMEEILEKEGKIVNVPVEIRQSNYTFLPSVNPHQFGKKRGRMYFSLLVNKTAEEINALEDYNRRIEGGRLQPDLWRRTLQNMVNGYFPYLKAEFKTKYPLSAFRPVKAVTPE